MQDRAMRPAATDYSCSIFRTLELYCGARGARGGVSRTATRASAQVAIAAVADARLTLNVSVGHSGRRTLASAHIEDQ